MDGYHIALAIHLFALVAASATSGLVHFAEIRFKKAESPAEAIQWLKFIGSTARAFPMAVVTLFLTGSYMVAGAHVWSWGAGFVQAGVTAVVLLMASGATIGIRSKAMGMAIGRYMQSGCTQQQLHACHDTVASSLMWMNTGLAMGVVIVMTIKPSPVAAFSTLLATVCTGLALNRLRAARSAAAVGAAELSR